MANDNEGHASRLFGLDVETGDVLWEHERETSRASFSTPVPHRRADGELEVLFAGTAHGLTALDPATGELLWERGDLFEQRTVGTPVAFDGMLFIWNDGGVVTCVDGAGGDTLWQERVGGDFYGSPLVIGELLLATSNAGELVVLSAAPEYELLNRLDLGEATQATPAVAGGRGRCLVLAHVDPAVAIDLPESIEFGPVGPDSIDVQTSPRKSPVVQLARRQPIWLSSYLAVEDEACRRWLSGAA